MVVSLSGLFLILFLIVHLSVNFTLILDDSGTMFNRAAHFMATNPLIRVVEPILAVGLLVHILLTIIITVKNYRARPTPYATLNGAANSSWASRNMFILGCLIASFLVLHLLHFFVKMKFTGDQLLTPVHIDGVPMKNSYLLVSTLFKESLVYSIFYIISAIFLGFHLAHGFWSAFQTLGLCNEIWLKRLQNVALVYATVIATGFSIIPLYFMLYF